MLACAWNHVFGASIRKCVSKILRSLFRNSMNSLNQQYHKLGLLTFCLFSMVSGPAIAANRADVRTGLDVLEGEAFLRLEGKRVGLITNRTGANREGKSNVELFLKSKVKLVALFSPEHGLPSDMDRRV